MSDRIGKAIENMRAGYNCSQAVVCAYCDLFEVDEVTAYKMAEGFGLGVGGMKEICGAVSGMVMVAGLKNSNGELSGPRTKADTYKLVKEMVKEFQTMNTSILCRDLLGSPGQPKLRSCGGCVKDASMLVEKYLLGAVPEDHGEPEDHS